MSSVGGRSQSQPIASFWGTSHKPPSFNSSSREMSPLPHPVARAQRTRPHRARHRLPPRRRARRSLSSSLVLSTDMPVTHSSFSPSLSHRHRLRPNRPSSHSRPPMPSLPPHQIPAVVHLLQRRALSPQRLHSHPQHSPPPIRPPHLSLLPQRQTLPPVQTPTRHAGHSGPAPCRHAAHAHPGLRRVARVRRAEHRRADRAALLERFADRRQRLQLLPQLHHRAVHAMRRRAANGHRHSLQPLHALRTARAQLAVRGRLGETVRFLGRVARSISTAWA